MRLTISKKYVIIGFTKKHLKKRGIAMKATKITSPSRTSDYVIDIAQKKGAPPASADGYADNRSHRNAKFYTGPPDKGRILQGRRSFNGRTVLCLREGAYRANDPRSHPHDGRQRIR